MQSKLAKQELQGNIDETPKTPVKLFREREPTPTDSEKSQLSLEVSPHTLVKKSFSENG